MKIKQPHEEDPLTKKERARSDFVHEFVQGYNEPDQIRKKYLDNIPKRIVQFWDDPNRLPQDVKECMDNGENLKSQDSNFRFSMRIPLENLLRPIWVQGMKMHLINVITLQ